MRAGKNTKHNLVINSFFFLLNAPRRGMCASVQQKGLQTKRLMVQGYRIVIGPCQKQLHCMASSLAPPPQALHSQPMHIINQPHGFSSRVKHHCTIRGLRNPYQQHLITTRKSTPTEQQRLQCTDSLLQVPGSTLLEQCQQITKEPIHLPVFPHPSSTYTPPVQQHSTSTGAHNKERGITEAEREEQCCM